MRGNEGDPALTEDLGEESDFYSEDEVEECVLNSETEQSGGETDEGDEESDETFYMGKDKKTKWSSKPPKKVVTMGLITFVLTLLESKEWLRMQKVHLNAGKIYLLMTFLS